MAADFTRQRILDNGRKLWQRARPQAKYNAIDK